jgi:hypothetical protein
MVPLITIVDTRKRVEIMFYLLLVFVTKVLPNRNDLPNIGYIQEEKRFHPL